jgi:hypothetical protein
MEEYLLQSRGGRGAPIMKEGSVEEAVSRENLGAGATYFAPAVLSKTVPRIDYERIFVLDDMGKLLGEYVLRDDCPLEFGDLQRAIPLSGMRHLVTFYQGEYAFTPFRVENLWFVVLTHGVPRIEERGSIGTLLAAMRVHLPLSLPPVYVATEEQLRMRASDLDGRETDLARREQRLGRLEADLQIAARELKEWESEIRSREARVNSLRDYAIQMQRALAREQTPSDVPRKSEGNPPAAAGSVPSPP